MAIPYFRPGDDPGPDFGELLRRVRGTAAVPDQVVDLPHGTTVVAVRFEGGVVMAGDRRATSGHLISHRRIEKVFPADRFSGVAIAGAAGPAVEMVRLFQLQLEHYEKVEGSHLSLEGKANTLGQMVRANLPAAMQGMVVVPIFAGFDLRRREGRLFEFDVTGGRYEEQTYATSGSGSLHAGTVLKLHHRDDLGRDEAVRLVVRSIMVAADEDSATGAPDVLRGIFPVVATITEDGFTRADDDELLTLVTSITDDGETGR
jgi:proteasome beta subunit